MSEEKKKKYEKPKVREISIDTRETLGADCRTSTNDANSDGCNTGPTGPCDQLP